MKAGDGNDATWGAITRPEQIGVIRAHVEDALKRGATALVGGLESFRSPFVDPIVLVDVPDDTPLMRQETFGPVLPVLKVRDAEEAIRRANDTEYGLSATVFGKRRVMDIARRLDVGMVSINSVLSYAGIPSLPFGGRGESGYGRIHGEDGLREFTLSRAITKQRFPTPAPLVFASFARAPWLLPTIGKIVRRIRGR